MVAGFDRFLWRNPLQLSFVSIGNEGGSPPISLRPRIMRLTAMLP